MGFEIASDSESTRVFPKKGEAYWPRIEPKKDWPKPVEKDKDERPTKATS